MGKLKAFSNGADRCLSYLQYVAMAMMAGILLICFLNVLLRNIFIGKFNWADEAMRFLLVYETFLMLPVLQANRKHITVDLIEVIFAHNATVRRAIYILSDILILVCMVILFPVGIEFLQKNMTGYSTSMQLPLWIVYSCLPIGFLMTIVACARNVAWRLSGEE